MSKRRYTLNPEPFEFPPDMPGWRLRKLKPKGAPEVIYGRDSVPLFLPMDISIEDVRNQAGEPGRYRIDPVDEE